MTARHRARLERAIHGACERAAGHIRAARADNRVAAGALALADVELRAARAWLEILGGA